jgi:DNA-binding transcriptional LysR family regulator
MRHLNEIECFVNAVELKSLTAAAKALKLPKFKIKSKIKNLEERVGMTFLTRTASASHLTEAGGLYFEERRWL